MVECCEYGIEACLSDEFKVLFLSQHALSLLHLKKVSWPSWYPTFKVWNKVFSKIADTEFSKKKKME